MPRSSPRARPRRASSPSRRPVSSCRSASGGLRKLLDELPGAELSRCRLDQRAAAPSSEPPRVQRRRPPLEIRIPCAVGRCRSDGAERLNQGGERRRAADVRRLVGNPHLDRAEARVRAGVPPAARVVLAGRLDVGLPVLRRREGRRLCAARQLAQPGRARRERAGLHTLDVRRVERESEDVRQPRNDRRERPQARLEALHADMHVQAAHELAAQLRTELLQHRAGSAARPRSPAPLPVRTDASRPRRPRGPRPRQPRAPHAAAGRARRAPPRPTRRPACSSRSGRRRARSSARQGRAASPPRAQARAFPGQ